MTTDINVGQLSEAINEKMDRDANNIESPKLPVFLVDVQYPTAENGYTWYRKYSDGWVEQGGKFVVNSASVAANTYSTATLTFPIPFSALISWNVQPKHDRFNGGFVFDTFGAASTVSVYQVNDSNTSAFTNPFVVWTACGFAA